jgi:hypothetical protein
MSALSDLVRQHNRAFERSRPKPREHADYEGRPCEECGGGTYEWSTEPCPCGAGSGCASCGTTRVECTACGEYAPGWARP